jgi:hypothetical protein
MEGNGSAALAVIEPQPHSSIEANVGVLMRRATDVAGVCREIVMKTAMDLQGKKYVKVEGWQSIAVAFGCVASSRNVERVAGGFRSIGEIRRMSDGAVIATAEGFVSEDEPVWFGGGMNKKTGKPYERRPESAIRAMAQTRSISRACRSAFSFIVTLIDGKLSTTPAEEMDFVEGEGGTIEPPPPMGVASLREKLRPPPSPPKAVASEPPAGGATPTHDRTMFFAFGRDKNKPLSELEEGSLKWFESKLLADLDDASKERWHEKTRQQLTTLRAELAYRGL